MHSNLKHILTSKISAYHMHEDNPGRTIWKKKINISKMMYFLLSRLNILMNHWKILIVLNTCGRTAKVWLLSLFTGHIWLYNFQTHFHYALVIWPKPVEFFSVILKLNFSSVLLKKFKKFKVFSILNVWSLGSGFSPS